MNQDAKRSPFNRALQEEELDVANVGGEKMTPSETIFGWRLTALAPGLRCIGLVGFSRSCQLWCLLTE